MILSHRYIHQKKWKLSVLQAANNAFLELLTYPQYTKNLSIKNLSMLKFSKGKVLMCYYKQQVNSIRISPTYLLTLLLYVMQSLPVRLT